MSVGRLTATMVLALLVQALVTVTSRLIPGPGGGFGAPAEVGHASYFVGTSARPGIVSFEPAVLLANLLVTAVVVLPMLPPVRPWGTAAAAAAGAAIVAGLGYAFGTWWFGDALEGIPVGIPVVGDGPFHPLSLWSGLLGSMFAGAFFWRRRGSERVTWSYGSTVVSRAVVACAVAWALQFLVTYTTSFAPSEDGSYGAPIPVGRSSGIGWGMVGAGYTTFDQYAFLANVILTAPIIFIAIPATRIWGAGVAALLAMVIGCVALVAYALTNGFGIGRAIESSDLSALILSGSWFLWGYLLLWAIAGALLWRRRAPRLAGAAAGPLLR